MSKGLILILFLASVFTRGLTDLPNDEDPDPLLLGLEEDADLQLLLKGFDDLDPQLQLEKVWLLLEKAWIKLEQGGNWLLRNVDRIGAIQNDLEELIQRTEKVVEALPNVRDESTLKGVCKCATDNSCEEMNCYNGLFGISCVRPGYYELAYFCFWFLSIILCTRFFAYVVFEILLALCYSIGNLLLILFMFLSTVLFAIVIAIYCAVRKLRQIIVGACCRTREDRPDNHNCQTCDRRTLEEVVSDSEGVSPGKNEKGSRMIAEYVDAGEEDPKSGSDFTTTTTVATPGAEESYNLTFSQSLIMKVTRLYIGMMQFCLDCI